MLSSAPSLVLKRLGGTQEPATTRKVFGGVGFSKQVFHSQQQVDIRSQDQWSCVTDHGNLHTTLDDKPRARCVLNSRCKVIFRRFTTGYGRTVETARSARRKAGVAAPTPP